MNFDYNDNFWKAVLKELEKSIQPRHFEFWFKDTKILAITEKAVKIRVGNKTIKEKISALYLEVLKNALFQCSGNYFEIELTCDPHAEQQAVFDFEEADKEIEFENSIEVVEPIRLPPPELNTLYTFANFVVGPSNQLAHAAAVAVVKSPGKAYNPLFIHGMVGLGKTHLLQAICQEALSQGEDQSIVYLSCEDFLNEFIIAVEQGNVNIFRYKYRHVNMLLIDDIHFLSNKERTQEEFFHTFNTLYNNNKQIILSSDSPPSEIPQLKERLISRFKWGLIAPIVVPSLETRMAIAKKKARLQNKEFPDNVCQYISENIVSNIRELEGAVNHLCFLADFQKKEITLEFSKKALRDMLHASVPEIDLSEIIEATLKYFDMKIMELQSKKRDKQIVIPRQICMYLGKKLTRYSLQEIGSFFGKDHTTVLHALEKIEALSKTNPSIAESLVEIEKMVLEKKYAKPSSAN